MKKLLLCLLIFTAVQLNAQITNDDAKLILTTGIKYNAPVDDIDEIQIGKDHLLYMYLTSENYNNFQADSIHFKVSQYNSSLDTFFDEFTYSLDVNFDWEWCYKAIYFNVAGTFKIEVFADDRFLTSTMVTSTEDLIG